MRALEFDEEAEEVVVRLQRKLYSQEAIRGAAVALSSEAAVYLKENGDVLLATIEPRTETDRAGLEALAARFLVESAGEALRRALLDKNRTLTEYVVTCACLASWRDPADPLQPPQASREELTPEQRAQADRLKAEAEAAFHPRAKA